MYGFNQVSVIAMAMTGVPGKIESLIKGIFHLQSLLAAGERDWAFNNRSLDTTDDFADSLEVFESFDCTSGHLVRSSVVRSEQDWE